MSNSNPSTSRIITGFDALKLILAVVVLVGHAEIKLWEECPAWLSTIDFSLDGVAVPAFFILSAWLLFGKIRQAKSTKEQIMALLRYERRILVLYLFWTVALMYWIIQIWHPEYAEFSFAHLRFFIKQLLFGSQFGASWFFGALIVGVPIVYLLGKWLGTKGIWIIPLIIYVYVYFGPANEELYHFYNFEFRHRADLSFLTALLFLAIGWMLYRDNMKRAAYAVPLWALWTILAVATITKCIFRYYEPAFDIIQAVVIVLLAFRWRCPMSRQLSLRLRAYSVHVFCVHLTVMRLIERSGFPFAGNPIIVAAVTLVISFVISECLILLMKIPGLKWLKYSK